MSTAQETLRGLLDAARLAGQVDPGDFHRIVRLSGGPTPQLPAGVDLLAAVRVLDRALELNPDEAMVLSWFWTGRLNDFGSKTPVEIISAGDSDAILSYIGSIESGSSG